MNMNECIFCRDKSGRFSTREHILPESLGGGDWAILPAGLYCDACQNRFGSKVERKALGDYPFSFFRVFIGIPTKKGKAPWLTSFEGKISGHPMSGLIGFDPESWCEKATLEGGKTQLRLLAHPENPGLICRFLLKMGLEVVAANDRDEIFDPKYDAARKFALFGKKDVKWWYLQREDMEAASRFIGEGVSIAEWSAGVFLEVCKVEEDEELLHIKLLYLDLFVPLTTSIGIDSSEYEEPEYRVFAV